MKDRDHQPTSPPGAATDAAAGTDALPRYEPPRVVKKRSVSRVTLSFTAGGVTAAGLPGSPG